MATKLGVSKSSVYDYLQEKGNPRADTLEHIYEGLGCSLENFIEDKSETGQDLSDPDFASLIGRLETLHPLLKPLVMRSYEMAEEILMISDVLNEELMRELDFRFLMRVTMVQCRRMSSGITTFPICPKCDCTFEREYQRFCDRCGQKLD